MDWALSTRRLLCDEMPKPSARQVEQEAIHVECSAHVPKQALPSHCGLHLLRLFTAAPSQSSAGCSGVYLIPAGDLSGVADAVTVFWSVGLHQHSAVLSCGCQPTQMLQDGSSGRLRIAQAPAPLPQHVPGILVRLTSHSLRPRSPLSRLLAVRGTAEGSVVCIASA